MSQLTIQSEGSYDNPPQRKHSTRAAINLVSIIGMSVCVGYVSICWMVILFPIGNLYPGEDLHLLFPEGLICASVGFVCSLLGWRRHPFLSKLTLAACFLWMVWAFLPRL